MNSLWLHFSDKRYGFSVQNSIFLESCKKFGYSSKIISDKENIHDKKVWKYYCDQVGWNKTDILDIGEFQEGHKEGFWPSYRIYIRHNNTDSGILTVNFQRLLSHLENYNEG